MCSSLHCFLVICVAQKQLIKEDRNTHAAEEINIHGLNFQPNLEEKKNRISKREKVRSEKQTKLQMNNIGL
jgi:hypothetical protein